jgi:hypothetical protein
MPRRSLVLDHPQLGRIDAEIQAGRDRRTIARTYGLPYMSVYRYSAKLLGGQAPAGSPAIADDPVQTFRAAFGLEPTDYQVALLTDTRSTIFLKGRQCGATQAAGALAIHTARSRPGADALVVSPSQDQSKEITRRSRLGLYELEEPLLQDAAELLRLRNGSRIISRPGNQRAVRGYAPALVIADEAAWIADETYAAIRPLLAASKGRFVAISTPGAKVGWFYTLWEDDLRDDWLRLKLPATDNPLIDPAFLQGQERELGEDAFRREYLCEFSAGAFGGTPLFTDIDSLFVDELEEAS